MNHRAVFLRLSRGMPSATNTRTATRREGEQVSLEIQQRAYRRESLNVIATPQEGRAKLQAAGRIMNQQLTLVLWSAGMPLARQGITIFFSATGSFLLLSSADVLLVGGLFCTSSEAMLM